MENNIEIKKEEQNNLTQTTKPPKKGKAVRTVALALCCSLVGSALGAGSVLAVDRFLVKPTTSIGRINDGDQMPGDTNNSFRRPGQMPGSGNSSENSDFNGNQGQNNNSQGMQAPPDNSGRNSMMPGQGNQGQQNQPATGQQNPESGRSQQNGNPTQNGNGQMSAGEKSTNG